MRKLLPATVLSAALLLPAGAPAATAAPTKGEVAPATSSVARAPRTQASSTSRTPKAVKAAVRTRTTHLVCTTAKGKLRADYYRRLVTGAGPAYTTHQVVMTKEAKVYRKGGPIMKLFPYTYKRKEVRTSVGTFKRKTDAFNGSISFTTYGKKNPTVTAVWEARHPASFHKVQATCTFKG